MGFHKVIEVILVSAGNTNDKGEWGRGQKTVEEDKLDKDDRRVAGSEENVKI